MKRIEAYLNGLYELGNNIKLSVKVETSFGQGIGNFITREANYRFPTMKYVSVRLSVVRKEVRGKLGLSKFNESVLE